VTEAARARCASAATDFAFERIDVAVPGSEANSRVGYPFAG
jgi:hypothetical protein